MGQARFFESSRILNEFYNQIPEEFLTFNPGLILGGTSVDFDSTKSSGSAFGKSNVIPQKVVVQGGLRFLSENQKEQARDKMRVIVSKNLPGTSAAIQFKDSYPAMSPTPGNMDLIETLR